MADSSKTLAESESRTQHLLEQMHAMMVELDETGRLIYVSPTVTEVLGYLPEELVATDVLGWIHPDDIGEIREFRRKLHGSGRAQDVAYRACHKDGRWLWLHTQRPSL